MHAHVPQRVYPHMALYMNGGCPVCRQNPTKIVKDLEELKVQGNEAPNEARYLEAIQQHEACLSRLNRLVDISKLRIALYLNLAHVYIKSQAWGKAKQNAEAVLVMQDVPDQHQGKASYRLALAEKGLGSWDAAHAALQDANRFVPGNGSIQRALSEFDGKEY